VRRGDDAHVGRLDDAAAEPLIFAGLDRAEQLDLAVERQFGDLVEEQGGAVRFLEAAGVAVERAGKAPFSWPNRTESTRFSGTAPQLTITIGRLPRGLELWIAVAISSLPEPRSPSISTGARARAALAAIAMAERNSGVEPTISSKGSGLEIFSTAGEARRCAGDDRWPRSSRQQPVRRERLDQEVVGAGPHRLDGDGNGRWAVRISSGRSGPSARICSISSGAGRARQPVLEQDGVDILAFLFLQQARGGIDIGSALDTTSRRARRIAGHQTALRGFVGQSATATSGFRPHAFPLRTGETA
jgi:hypothetical protein